MPGIDQYKIKILKIFQKHEDKVSFVCRDKYTQHRRFKKKLQITIGRKCMLCTVYILYIYGNILEFNKLYFLPLIEYAK